ncbi:VaFE repeat-containing surface-anchored protein, partial [Corynebacterium sp. CTNIH6]
MSKLRNITREGWMVFTAVLAAIAVVAAMVTVPGAKAEDSNNRIPMPTANDNFADPYYKGGVGSEPEWGNVVWAGKPVTKAEAEKAYREGKKVNPSAQGNANNDVGWALCIDPGVNAPMNNRYSYTLDNAAKLDVEDRYRDAAISLAIKLKQAYEANDKEASNNYWVYLAVLVGHMSAAQEAAHAVLGHDLGDLVGPTYQNFHGSADEFTKLTGFEIVNAEGKNGPELREVPDAAAKIEKQPEEYYITIVGPNGNPNGLPRGQRVMPIDQPGLPDNGGGSEEPTTSPENPGGETSPSETTENPEPSGSETTTPKDTTSETTPDKTTDVVPNPEPTPTTSEQQKDLEPKIETEASIKDGNRVEKGATVIDTVTYKDLVPGKKYTLKAKLISKADGETVLGEGSEELVPEESAGKKDVEITVNDKADPAVDAAVAFEKLVSTEVDKDGNETTGSTDENVIATHEDINDEKQTVNTKWAPSIKTNADFDNAKQVKAGVTVKDTVTYTDLVPGKEYTLKAELRNKAENAEGEHDVVGKGEVTFTPKKSAGEQVVDIKVNDHVEGVIKAAVAFEDLYSKQVDENGKETPNSDEEKKITEHRDIDDEDQTVTSKQTPKISTNADFEDGSHEVVAGAKIVDEV